MEQKTCHGSEFTTPLDKETEIRLIFHGDAYKTLNNAKLESYKVHCRPVDLSKEFNPAQDVGDVNGEYGEIEYFDFAGEATEFKVQPDFGVKCEQTSHITFRIRTSIPNSQGIQVSVYTLNNSFIGCGLLLPHNMMSSTGHHVLPVMKTNQMPQGEISVDFVVIKPIQEPSKAIPSPTFDWKHKQASVYMGHRGMGKNRAKDVSPYYIENTIGSFNKTLEHGVQYVELDLLLTKDHVPVVFHDFFCQLSCSNGTDSSSVDVQFDSLTYKQLKSLKIGFTGCPIKEEDYKDGDELFPTLQEICQQVDPAIGFNLEIKYPMRIATGAMEDDMTNLMDMNQYVDIMLKHILNITGDRKIMISSFVPEVCVMLRQKQSRFPVSFITQLQTKRYAPFLDPRTHFIIPALRWAKAESFLGVNPISEYILDDLTVIQMAIDLDLVLMCWGSENTDPEVVKTLRENHTHVIIFDRVNEVMAVERKALGATDGNGQISKNI